jgi:hypothetical protein
VHATFANALMSLGAVERSVEVCANAYEHARGRTPPNDLVFVSLHWTWAQGETALGRAAQAVALLDRVITEIEPVQSPLLLGRSHGERALAHSALGDSMAYERDLASMRAYFTQSGHPVLLAQADRFAIAPTSAALRSSIPPPSAADRSATTLVSPASRRSRPS